METLDAPTGSQVAKAPAAAPDPSPQTRFRVRPGRVYELRLLLHRPGGQGLAFGRVRPVFRDRAGEPLDPRLYAGSPDILHARSSRLEILPQTDDDEVLMAAGESSRFLLAPPDAVELTLEGLSDPGSLRSARLRPMGILWSSPQAARLKSDHSKIAAERRRLIAGRHQLSPADQADLDASLDMPVRQIEALQAHFGRAGNWAPVLEAMAGEEEQAACRARLARRRSQADREIHAGFVGSERGYERLSAMARVTWLRQDRLQAQLSHLSLDLVVVEAAPVSGIERHEDEWALAFSSLDGSLPAAGQRLFDAARAAGLPVHFWITRQGSYAGLYLGAARAADRVLSEGDPDPAIAPEVDDVLPRGTEPAACCPPTGPERSGDLTLVPVGSDAFDSPEFAELLAVPTLHDTLVTDFDRQTSSGSLLTIFDKTLPRVVGPHSRSTQRALLRAATIVLLSRTATRDEAELEAIALDAIASGAIPVLFGNPGRGGSILARLDRVFSAPDLVELQALYRVGWVRERRWRGLSREVMRRHVPRQRERRILLGRDPFPAAADAPAVSAVLVAARPEALKRGIDSFRRQTWPGKDLTIVAQTAAMPDLDLAPGETLVAMPASATLGQCLAYAVPRLEGRYWALLSADCDHAESCLEDLVRHFRASQANAVACGTALAFDAAADRTIGLGPVGTAASLPGADPAPQAVLAGDRLHELSYAALAPLQSGRGTLLPDLEDGASLEVYSATGAAIATPAASGQPGEEAGMLTRGTIFRRFDHEG